MTAWHIIWHDSRSRHEVSYSNIASVFRHVEHCLNQGWEIYGIHKVWGKGGHSRCIFHKDEKEFKLKRAWVLEALGQYGELTAVGIERKVVEVHDVAIWEQTVRSMLSRLSDAGLIEKVPDTKPIKWRLKK